MCWNCSILRALRAAEETQTELHQIPAFPWQLLAGWGSDGGCSADGKIFEHLEQQAAARRLRPSRSEGRCQRSERHHPVYFCHRLVKEQEAGSGSQVIHTHRTISGRGEEGEVNKRRDREKECTDWDRSIQSQEARNNGWRGWKEEIKESLQSAAVESHRPD